MLQQQHVHNELIRMLLLLQLAPMVLRALPLRRGAGLRLSRPTDEVAVVDRIAGATFRRLL